MSSLKVWDSQTGNLLQDLRANLGSIDSAMFSNDGTKLVGMSELGAVIYEVGAVVQ